MDRIMHTFTNAGHDIHRRYSDTNDFLVFDRDILSIPMCLVEVSMENGKKRFSTKAYTLYGNYSYTLTK